MDVTYIGPKYISRDCKILVPDHHITVGSLESAGFKVTPLYTDSLDESTILTRCWQDKPAAVVFGGTKPPAAVLYGLESLLIPRIYLWWDHTSPQNQELAEKVAPYVDLNVVMDMTTPAPSKYPDKYLYMWYPLDTRLFNKGADRDIDVCFLGTVLPEFSDRIHYLSLLEKAGRKIYVRTGVYRENPLTIEEYASALKRSKIALNFTMLPQYQCHQSKTRTTEVMHCGAMLLESDSEHTRKRYVEGEEYVAFNSAEDLTAKIGYYLAHEEERARIADRGWSKTTTCYTDKLFWQVVFDKIGLPC